MSYAAKHLKEASEIIEKLDIGSIEKVADLLAKVKSDQGRIFFLGVVVVQAIVLMLLMILEKL